MKVHNLTKMGQVIQHSDVESLHFKYIMMLVIHI